MKSKIFCLFFLVFYIQFAPAASLTKESFIEKMIPAMGLQMCKAEMPFMKCSKFTNKKCEALAKEVVTVCMNQMNQEMPAMIEKESAKVWLDKLGDCAGPAFIKKANKGKSAQVNVECVRKLESKM